MANKKLVDFIKEARRRGFGDLDIKRAILNHGWPLEEVEKAFAYLAPKYEGKNQVTLFLSTEMLWKKGQRKICSLFLNKFRIS